MKNIGNFKVKIMKNLSILIVSMIIIYISWNIITYKSNNKN
jgi:hypothetical protein